MRFARHSATLAMLAAAVIAAAAQDQSQPQRPVIRREASFVRVDVYATKDGVPLDDLQQAEFTVLENGKPQTIATFEHILIRGNLPQAVRTEPNTIEQSRAAAANPRNRVVIIFLDTGHVSFNGSGAIGAPLARMLDRILGPDDLIGLMTPNMAPSEIVFARKTDVLTNGLENNRFWGRRFNITGYDLLESAFMKCYPPMIGESPFMSGLAEKLIDRKREREALTSLRDLVAYTRDLREERKAIITVTEGWLLYRPDMTLTNLRKDAAGQDPIPGIDTTLPRRPVRGDEDRDSLLNTCAREALALAAMDNDRKFKDLMGDANWANATFYTVDPRGLAVFDTPIAGSSRPLTVTQDYEQLRLRTDNMRILADNTDGFAVIGSNDFDKGLKRIADDLTSYYLVGYYTSNPKPDGKYRTIDVKVTRPGVSLRARKGYRAPTAEDIANVTRTATVPAVAPEVAAVATAVATLDRPRETSRAGAAPALEGAPMWFHRGPSTGNQLARVTEPYFTRTHRVHVEWPIDAAVTATAMRLLDRKGQPLSVPVSSADRTDEQGRRFATGDIVLSPLAAGDYVLELKTMAGGAEKTAIAAFRVLR